MRYELLNQAWALTNEPEILAIAEANGIGKAWLQPMADGFLGCKGFNPEQLTVIPDMVSQEPHIPDEANYGLDNAISHATKIALVKLATPITAMNFDTVIDYFVIARQHGALIPIG